MVQDSLGEAVWRGQHKAALARWPPSCSQLPHMFFLFPVPPLFFSQTPPMPPPSVFPRGQGAAALSLLCVWKVGALQLSPALSFPSRSPGAFVLPTPSHHQHHCYYLHSSYSSCPTSPPRNCFTAITSYHYGWRTWVIILPSAGNVNHSLHPLITMSLPVVESRR